MQFFKWAESSAKRLKWYDYSLVKLAVFAFALFAAKLYPPLLSLGWYWYAAIFVLASLPVLFKMLKK